MKGAALLADAVKLTLGPFSQHAAIEKNDEIIDDGVTVAREIVSGGIHDEIEQRGARMLLEVATKTEEIAGDGTTTAIILGNNITKEASKLLSDGKTFVGKKTSSEVVQMIEKEREEVTKKLIDMAEKVISEEQLISSTQVSASDEILGYLIGEAQWELGPDGIILAEESAEKSMDVVRIHGIRTDNGFGTPALITNPEKQSLEVDESRILLTNHIFHGLGPIKELGESLAKMGVKKLTIIARAFDENAIRDCLANFQVGFAVYPINAPYTDMSEMMKDLSAITGAKYINTDERNLESIQLSDIGFAHKIVAKYSECVIAGKEDDKIKERVDKRIAELEAEMKGAVSEFRKKTLAVRVSQLKNGFSLLKVGAVSEIRRKYLKRKADDAVGSARAALQEGLVPGGGVAFKTIAESMPDESILKRPLMSIYEQIMSSAPKDWVVSDKVKDPVKVLRIALEQACSVASTFANAGIAIAEERMRPMDMALRKLVDTSKKEGDVVQ